ncbi:MAG: VIT domain-containing protein [Spirochaetota bacterium]
MPFFAFSQNVPPALFITGAEKAESLKTTRLAIEVRIYGTVSETRMTMTFFNPSNKQVAGDLYVPLPEKAVVSGFALDINGVLVDGVPVEKQKGQQVFEKIVRQGIDPGLAEWTKGSSFKSRVFPIPAKGSRTIMVRYLSDITDKAGIPTYYLPLKYKDAIGDFTIRVEVVRPEDPPTVRESSFSNFTFRKWHSSYVAETSLSGAVLNKDLYISLPKTEKQPVKIEKDKNGRYYFTIDSIPPLPEIKKTFIPKQIAVYWDASGSRYGSKLEKSLKFLSDYFSSLKTDIVRVVLIVFRNVQEQPVIFNVRNGNSRELISFLKGIPYDGATQIGALTPPPGESDFALLFTDGISNFGVEEPPLFGVPLYIFSEDSSANYQFMKYLALKNNGEFFNLNAADISTIIKMIGRQVFGFVGVKVVNGEVEELFPQLPQPVMDSFRLTGQLVSRSAAIVLQYGAAGKVEMEHAYTVSRDSAEQGNLLSLVWAQEKLNELLIFSKRNQALISDLGKEFGLVTPGTSLIVLDRLEQYVEHRIPPPESLKEMRAQYFDIIAQEKKEAENRQEQKINYVLSLWQERITWWNKKFTYPKNFKVREAEKKESEAREPRAAEGAAPPSAMMDMSEAEKSMAEPEPEEAFKEDVAIPGIKSEPEPEPEIALKAWDPDTPYLAALKKTDKSSVYAEYLSQREAYSSSPAFFLDCADFFFNQGLKDLGLRILSNLAELELENAALLRILAHRLEQLDLLSLSRYVFEEVLRLRPEEPQSYRDLALVLGRLGEYEKAIPLLTRVIFSTWERFEEVEVIALMELNNMLPIAKAKGITNIPLDARLIKLLDVDIRIVLTWDADLTDMDLWVVEPSDEKAYYGNPLTRIGGHMSRDFTDGYGPEEYLLKKAMKGTYKIQVNYFSDRAPSLSGSVTLQVEIFTNYGRQNEQRKTITVRLRENNDTLNVGEITF